MSDAPELQAFLIREGLEVLDIVRGAAPATRRLILGEARSGRATRVVALASEPSGGAAVESEMRHLRELQHRLRPGLRSTIPSVVETITMGDAVGVVISAVPGTEPRRAGPRGSSRVHAGAVLEWLTMLWEDTAGAHGSIDLGREANDVLFAMLAGSRGGAPTLGALHRSRAAVSAAATPRTVIHGCLCPRHVHISGGRVTGVDDWGLARFDADPLRDLGGWVVATAGPRIGTVLARQTRFGRTLGDMVVEGLAHWGIPPALWRDVLVLCLAETAVAGLAQDDAAALDLLAGISRDLSGTNSRGDS